MNKKILVKLAIKYFLNEVKEQIVEKIVSFIINQTTNALEIISEFFQ